MRIIILGDKSKYQFCRYLIDISDLENNESFLTEQLSLKDIFIVSDKRIRDNNHFFSTKIPLNTVLFFPKEFEDFDDFTKDDKIIFFDEFPYNTEDYLERLYDIKANGSFNQLEVVLFQNSREGLVTDLSSNSMALSDAREKLTGNGICFSEYQIGDHMEFLFWRNEGGHNEKSVFQPLLDDVKAELETFDSSYNYLCETTVGPIIKDPAIWNNIIKFDNSFVGKNLWEQFGKRSYLSLLKNNNEIQRFYINTYKSTVMSIIVWNFDKDIQVLNKIVKKEFLSMFNDGTKLYYYGKKEDYEEFINNHKEVLLGQSLFEDFFYEDLKEIIKQRICIHVSKMEGLLNGHIN